MVAINSGQEREMTGADLVRADLAFPEAVLDAVKEYARAKPWRGTFTERKAKMEEAHGKLVRALSITRTLLVHESAEMDGDSLASFLSQERIVLHGRLSVMTMLHLTALAGGMDSFQAFVWSINLFQRAFPRSFARLRWEGFIARRAAA